MCGATEHVLGTRCGKERCIHLVERFEVELSKLFNVDGATFVVGLVVVLRVIFVDILLFRVFKRVIELFYLEIFAPLFSLGEHGLGSGEIPFSGTKESAEASIVMSLGIENALVLDGVTEGVECFLLGSVEVAWAAALCGVSHGWL